MASEPVYFWPACTGWEHGLRSSILDPIKSPYFGKIQYTFLTSLPFKVSSQEAEIKIYSFTLVTQAF